MKFTKATKKESRGRIALMGPSGSGKTFTALAIASALGSRVAVIDTERGSASKYSDRFAFDVLELETFAPLTYVEAIHAAEAAGYDVIVIDSLTHAWTGKEGALEQVDKAAARSRSSGGNSFTAWKDVTPMHNALIDAMTRSSAHIVATMRSKMEYVIEEDGRGKKVPRKVGMAPEQRAGMEYEFDLVGDLDQDHRLVVTKSRCDALADHVEVKPGAKFAQVFRAWLSGEPLAPPSPLEVFRKALGATALPADAVALYAQHRASLGAEGKSDLWRRVAELQKVSADEAGAWIKRKLQELDEGDDPDPTPGGAGGSPSKGGPAKAAGGGANAAASSGPVGLAEAWMGTEEGIRGYLSQRAVWPALENAVRKHARVIPVALRVTFLRLAAYRLQTLSADQAGAVLPLDGPKGCKAQVMAWADEGPTKTAAQRRAAATVTTASTLVEVA